MLTARDAKAKIRSVRSIDQICRAMKTVASVRLRRAEGRLESARPYQRALAGLVARVAAASEEHPRQTFGGQTFPQPRDAGRTAPSASLRVGLVLITSDRGLCGGYNANAVRRALLVGGPKEVGVIAVGRRGQVQMARRGYEIVERLVPLGGEPEAAALRWLADRIGDLYAEGRFGEVVVVFSRFLGGTRCEVRADRLLPLRLCSGQALALAEVEEPARRRRATREAAGVAAAQPPPDIILEPPLAALLPGLLRRYVRGQLAGMVWESSASEHAARVAAMAAATDNAEEMMRDLTLAYNKARQAGITKELTEIVAASEAAV